MGDIVFLLFVYQDMLYLGKPSQTATITSTIPTAIIKMPTGFFSAS